MKKTINISKIDKEMKEHDNCNTPIHRYTKEKLELELLIEIRDLLKQLVKK